MQTYKGIAVAAATVFLAACGTLEQCGPDWYAIGERDGVLGAQPQAEIYAQRCAAPVDTRRYREGWEEGFSRRPRPTV